MCCAAHSGSDNIGNPPRRQLNLPASRRPPLVSTLSESLARLNARIAAACAAHQRDRDSVRLIAVSKGVRAERLAEALSLGQTRFGESYLQEALPKLGALPRERVEWHFIGPVQSNKTRDIAGHFDWVHGVERLKIAERLSAQRPQSLPPLQVCVQVNISGEASKSGCDPAEAAALCTAILRLPGLRLRGLMCIPAPVEEGGDARAPFRTLRALFESLKPVAGPDFDSLSAGMSDDLEAAIAEGATLIRVGSALFGERTP